LRVEKEISLKKLKKGIARKDSDWIYDKIILCNYEDSGLLTENPNIKVINSEYLVFSRGGYYFGLYDLKLDSAIVNINNTFGEWRYVRDEKECSRMEIKKEYGKWVKENLHEKIEEYITESHSSP